MKQFWKSLPALLKETAREWSNDNAMRLAAALAYYTVFSLAPLLLAAIAISSMIFGQEAASGRIFLELKTAIGPSAATAVEDLAKAAAKPSTGIPGTILSLGLALFGASGVFGELKESLNQIWGIKPPSGGGVLAWIRGRFLSIGMVMGVCFLLLVSMGLSAFLTTLTERAVPGGATGSVVMLIATQLFSLAAVTLLFAAMFRYLPYTRIAWKDVWVGGAFTAVMFNLGKFGLEQYVARAAPASSFGAASSLALILVWVYYSAQIFLFGAEFTEVYARHHGTRQTRSAPRHLRQPGDPEDETDLAPGESEVSPPPATDPELPQDRPVTPSGGMPDWLIGAGALLALAWMERWKKRP